MERSAVTVHPSDLDPLPLPSSLRIVLAGVQRLWRAFA